MRLRAMMGVLAPVLVAAFAASPMRTALPPHLEVLRREAMPRTPTTRRGLEEAKAVYRRAMAASGHIRAHLGASLSRRSAPVRQQPVTGASPRRVYPTDFGADPTGKTDSTDAMKKAMAALLDPSKASNRSMAAGIKDFGTATLDLAGGEYLISEPLVFPTYVGNVQVVAGTLRASSSFPTDAWLVMVGSPACTPQQQGCCNEFINFAEMLFDSSHRAAGGVYVAHTMGTTIGPSVFFHGYRKAGIDIEGGHEVMVQQAWLSEFYWDEKHDQTESIGILINGNDHYLTDTILFDYSKVGVEVNHAANILDGVHTWNGGGVGIAIHSPQNRLLGCYLDFNTLLITHPVNVFVEGGFFLDTNAVLQSTEDSKLIDGLVFRDNDFRNINVPSIEINGSFSAGGCFDIQDERSVTAPTVRTSRARQSMRLEKATVFSFDFDELLLPVIEEVMYSVTIEGTGFPRHAARAPNGTKVTIELDEPITGAVTVEVVQGLQGCRKSNGRAATLFSV